MRRRLNPVLRYPVDFCRDVGRDWNAFWYTPADPTLLGALRILTGLMLLYTHAVWGLALEHFYGPTPWLSAGLVREIQSFDFACTFWWWVPAGAIWPAHVVSMAILFLFTIGLRTRVTSVLALVVAISYAQRVPAATFGLDQINVMLTLYLAIGPSGQALSIDRLLLRRRRGEAAMRPAPSIGANFALRLINVHMCVIYFFAGVSKLQGDAWWTGEAMWRAFANLEYQSIDMTWMANHPLLMNLMTHTSILWEISFAFLIWRPRWRPLMLAGAVVVHLGIGACMGMWTFALIMLVGNASFLPPDGFGRLVASLGRRPEAEGPVARPTVAPRSIRDRGVLEPAHAADPTA